MQTVDLGRRRGMPFSIATAYFADNTTIKLTGDGMSILDYIRMTNQPAVTFETILFRDQFVPNEQEKRIVTDVYVPSRTKSGSTIVRSGRMTGGDLKKRRSPREPLRGHPSDIAKIHQRQMFVVTCTWVDHDMDRRVTDILCTFRKMPKCFPGKLRHELIDHPQIDWSN